MVASFDPTKGQNAENLAVPRDGTVYVTRLFAHSVVAIRPDGAQAVVTLPQGEASRIAGNPARPDRLTVGLVRKTWPSSLRTPTGATFDGMPLRPQECRGS